MPCRLGRLIHLRGACVIATLAGSVLGAEPDAGTTDLDTARALFQEGRELAAAGKYAEACPKFEKSLEYDDGIGARFNWADCLEHRGRMATARNLFLEVAERAREKGQAERETAARERAAKLDVLVPQLIIEVRQPIAHLVITRDGAVVPQEAWGSVVNVDPGIHEVHAAATGYEEWSIPVKVPASARTTIVQIPKLESLAPEALASRTPNPTCDSPSRPHQSPVAPPTSSTLPGWVYPALLYGGVGGGVLLAGTSLVLLARTNEEARKICPSSVGCSAEDIRQHDALVSDARTLRALSYLGFGIGGAALAAAGVLALTVRGRQEAPPTARLRAAPVVSSGTLGAVMVGNF